MSGLTFDLLVASFFLVLEALVRPLGRNPAWHRLLDLAHKLSTLVVWAGISGSFLVGRYLGHKFSNSSGSFQSRFGIFAFLFVWDLFLLTNPHFYLRFIGLEFILLWLVSAFGTEDADKPFNKHWAQLVVRNFHFASVFVDRICFLIRFPSSLVKLSSALFLYSFNFPLFVSFAEFIAALSEASQNSGSSVVGPTAVGFPTIQDPRQLLAVVEEVVVAAAEDLPSVEEFMEDPWAWTQRSYILAGVYSAFILTLGLRRLF